MFSCVSESVMEAFCSGQQPRIFFLTDSAPNPLHSYGKWSENARLHMSPSQQMMYINAAARCDCHLNNTSFVFNTTDDKFVYV